MKNLNLTPKATGVALAMAAAGLVGGCATSETSTPAASSTDTVALVQCSGVNKCGGHNDCATADNKCGGHASCKGSGWVAMPEKACADIGGEVGDVTASVAQSSDLIHCSGVNICAGHNDCGTANNSCAGQASCKGTGFVGTTAKSCDDIGGTIDA